MVLEVVQYGDPILRRKGARIERITPELRRLIADMFETMYAAHGIGLAAQQVGHALQLTVIDIRGVEDRPSTLELNGEPADPCRLMPLVLINPEIEPLGPSVAGPEGCLSFPEIYAEIVRPDRIEVRALDGEGRPLQFRCGGLLARAVQHEYDHLQGILFIDRMDRRDLERLRPELEALQAATRARLARRAAAR
ncbi:peptide deformylase [Limisphaera ngatamarikiensis]|jgi:peptide deformylase|uniref:Peptide deformylase n=1 Tax=Limisphaera ngatamarikiensis TaxID=1324935 RepID=A0A6M1RFK1_9BACT|nr:peptide deformylase [Limisphaera ngatamarikiensis]NGO38818.1 peptide deformylase [Limisphaera ngatamarikiensis]